MRRSRTKWLDRTNIPWPVRTTPRGFERPQFLDLFSGSGSVGIEALSRGAGHATFVDFAKDCCNVSERAQLWEQNAGVLIGGYLLGLVLQSLRCSNLQALHVYRCTIIGK